jgi:hypothetical protein
MEDRRAGGLGMRGLVDQRLGGSGMHFRSQVSAVGNQVQVFRFGCRFRN